MTAVPLPSPTSTSVCRCASPCAGGSPKLCGNWTGKPSLHDRAWASYAVSREDWDSTLAKAHVEERDCGDDGEEDNGDDVAAEPAEEPLLADAAAPTAGPAAPAAIAVPATPSATELSYLRKPPPTA